MQLSAAPLSGVGLSAILREVALAVVTNMQMILEELAPEHPKRIGAPARDHGVVPSSRECAEERHVGFIAAVMDTPAPQNCIEAFGERCRSGL